MYRIEWRKRAEDMWHFYCQFDTVAEAQQTIAELRAVGCQARIADTAPDVARKG